MAEQEQDREDLLREATALVERIELRGRLRDSERAGAIRSDAEPLVIGFRRDGAISFFFGADPVLQFNAQGELRRAYHNGRLLKAERGHLVELKRERRPEAVLLVRREMTPEETRAYLDGMLRRLHGLRQQLQNQAYTISGQVPEDRDLLGRIQRWLAELPDSIVIARRPHAGGA